MVTQPSTYVQSNTIPHRFANQVLETTCFENVQTRLLKNNSTLYLHSGALSIIDIHITKYPDPALLGPAQPPDRPPARPTGLN